MKKILICFLVCTFSSSGILFAAVVKNACPFAKDEDVLTQLKAITDSIETFNKQVKESPTCQIKTVGEDYLGKVASRLNDQAGAVVASPGSTAAASVYATDMFGCNNALVINANSVLSTLRDQPSTADLTARGVFSGCKITDTTVTPNTVNFDNACAQKVLAGEKAKCLGSADIEQRGTDTNNAIVMMQNVGEILKRPECFNKANTDSLKGSLFNAVASHVALGSAFFPGIGIAMLAPVIKSLFLGADKKTATDIMNQTGDMSKMKCLIYESQKMYCDTLVQTGAVTATAEIPQSISCTQDELLGSSKDILKLAKDGIDAAFDLTTKPNAVFNLVKKMSEAGFTARLQEIINATKEHVSNVDLTIEKIDFVNSNKKRLNGAIQTIEAMIAEYKHPSNSVKEGTTDHKTQIQDIMKKNDAANKITKEDLSTIFAAYREMEKEKLTNNEQMGLIAQFTTFEAQDISIKSYKNLNKIIGDNLDNSSLIMASLNEKAKSKLNDEFTRVYDDTNKACTSSKNSTTDSGSHVGCMKGINDLYHDCKLLSGTLLSGSGSSYADQLQNFSTNENEYNTCQKLFPDCLAKFAAEKNKNPSENAQKFICSNLNKGEEGLDASNQVCGKDRSFYENNMKTRGIFN
jgi:hypothetical protein